MTSTSFPDQVLPFRVTESVFRTTTWSYVVRGRARLGLGDGGGVAELEEWLEQVVLHESATTALGCRQWLAGALHHWRGPAAEWHARQDLEALAQARGLQVITSMGIAENVRVLYELGKLRQAIELADTIGAIPDAQPRWAAVQRALALLDLGQLGSADICAVAATPPADDGDLRHVLGSALVHAGAAMARHEPGQAADVLRRLGDAQRFAERDGAVELLPRPAPSVPPASPALSRIFTASRRFPLRCASTSRQPSTDCSRPCGTPRDGRQATGPCPARLAGLRFQDGGRLHRTRSRAEPRRARRSGGARCALPHKAGSTPPSDLPSVNPRAQATGAVAEQA